MLWGALGLLVQSLDAVPGGQGAPPPRSCAVSASSIELLWIPKGIPKHAGCQRSQQLGRFTDEYAERQIFNCNLEKCGAYPRTAEAVL